MKINFIMPGKPKYPSGGYKVVYEYSKKLVEDGNEVIITYPFLHSPHGIPFKDGKYNKFKYKLRFYKEKYFRKTTCKSWFRLPKSVKEKLVYSLDDEYIDKADIVIATAWSTAENVDKYRENKGKKYYLIQSFEDWNGPTERVISTWKNSLKKIVISDYLKKIADNLEEESELIENGLNFKDFYCENIEKDKNSIFMLYHSNESVKRSKEAIIEIGKLKEEIPDLKLRLFGTEKRPEFLESWIEYYQKPEIDKLRELYNRSQIFVGPSRIEGWPLPVAESMQCETMVCVTDIPAHSHIVHLKNGYKIKELSELGEALKYLLSNDKLRLQLGKEGNIFIKKYTWELAYKKFKEYVLN